MMKRIVRFVVMLASLALLYTGYRVAAHNGWIIVTRGQRSFDLGTEPAFRLNDGRLSILVVGDTGEQSRNRQQVAAAMAAHAGWSSPNAAFLLGDNFYEQGVASVDDARFDQDFEQLFPADCFRCPFYVCLGNHDYQGNVQAQVDYTQHSERWKMPERYYRTRLSSADVTVDVFVVDTVAIHLNHASTGQQLRWLEENLLGSEADWQFVLGHHPILTGGKHEPSPQVARLLAPIFRQCGVDLYLSGHDHDLQLSDSGDGWWQVVSGAGSKLRSTSWIEQTVFARAAPGFCWLLIEPARLHVSFYSPNDRLFSTSILRSPSNASSPDSRLGTHCRAGSASGRRIASLPLRIAPPSPTRQDFPPRSQAPAWERTASLALPANAALQASPFE
ncbi:hypothetical protein FYK55_26130 [Roseiconus nitratireducens]|uniref:Calcineurin-like phosphoesterase domain-containing protein n=1 Tax=Roseiconus nitratireducens TaxID=2605748 RepID=A0A5M6CUI4_9BACT|nr:metallophosphoesterase [Roseiconus nitratireducens]KAA5538917.1 hypothetical protein FYK55_26130 [Roseiconus nitratireducens]